MIDSGATNSFVNSSFLGTTHIPLVQKDVPLELQVIDGRPISSGAITHHSALSTLSISGHEENISLDITSLGNYPVILGLPWLSLHNPEIDWKNQSIIFNSKHCLNQCIPSRSQPDTPVLGDQSHKVIDTQSTPPIQSRLETPIPPPRISLVSVAAFRLALKKTDCVYGFNTPAPYHEPDQWDDDDKDPDLLTLRKLIPTQFHHHLDVFRKSNFDKLPEHSKYDHSIPLEGDLQPPFGPIYSLSEVELKALDEYLKDNIRKGFIQPSQSPAGAPILFVKKSDGSLRLCVDYRGLNKITRKNRYPLPLIQESLDRLKEASVFSKVDLKAAYNLVRIAKGDKWKTAFRTRYGLFEYQVMPFGLTNAPASFQYLINDVLRDFLDVFVIVYLDDILIFSKTESDHVQHVNQVLERLKSNNLWANAEKCRFYQKEVDFLGYLVSNHGVRMDPKKVESVTSWPTPKSIHDIQVFLGFANFYRRFIRSYSKVTAPLTRLLRKDVKFDWTAKEEDSFQTLKVAFTTAPILCHFKPDRPIVIETDASDFAIAGVLSQPSPENAKILHPVAFYSRKLQPAELNYDIFNKEMLAIVEALKQWRAYLEGAEGITVYSDHKNLEYFTQSKVLNRRQARWAEYILAFDFTIIYREGKSMGKPDALTRRQDLQEGSRAADAPPQSLLKPGQFIIASTGTSPMQSDVHAQIREAQPKDDTLKEIIPYLLDVDIPQDDVIRK